MMVGQHGKNMILQRRITAEIEAVFLLDRIKKTLRYCTHLLIVGFQHGRRMKKPFIPKLLGTYRYDPCW